MRVVFAIPGREFSNVFFTCWTKLVAECLHRGIEIILSQQLTREKCLGADVLKGPDQQPFNGEHYDYLMWIDHNIVFEPNDFFILLDHLESNTDVNVISGFYVLEEGKNNFFLDFDTEFFIKHGKYENTSFDDMKLLMKKSNIIPVAFCGLGFCLFRKGVFEKLKYPWFYRAAETISTNGKSIIETNDEVMALFKNLNDVGIQTYVHFSVHLGHYF